MRTIEQKLASLNENDIWLFTKQTAVFDEAFKMARLFSEIPDIEDTNIEQYFEEHHGEYGIATHRHRALVIAQMFGLLTKTKFFDKSSYYHKEKVTAVFEELNKYEIGSKEYNTIKSEQLLKVRIKAIIDTTKRNYDQVILPLLFSFAVLWELKQRGINSITIGQFYTYVMTCKSYSELEEAIELLSLTPSESDLVPRFKDKSRIGTLIDTNCNLFSFQGDSVSINKSFGDYFYKSFFVSANIERLNLLLDRPADYAYFLYNHQNFGVNIIDAPDIDPADIVARVPKIISDIDGSIESEDDENNYDAGYVNLVDEFKEDNINTTIANGASEKEPQYVSVAGRKSVSKNPLLGKIAIMEADYKCIADVRHRTFESKRNGKDFMEAHHLIPIKYSQEIWNRFSANVDCKENLVSLCPNCHRAVHYGSNRVKQDVLTRLYNEKHEELMSVDINITLEDLLAMY